MPELNGFSHLGLSVKNLEISKKWYEEIFGWQLLMDGEATGTQFAFGFLTGGVGLGLSQHAKATTEDFSPDTLGLDHASFGVDSRAALEEWEEHLISKKVKASPIVDAPYGHVLSFKDPDGIALELFTLAS